MLLFSGSKKYKYIGPEEQRELISAESAGHRVKETKDILNWIYDTDQHVDNHEVIATYVVLKDKYLYIADRHEEHVVCAQGKDVLSAGEITFEINKGKVEVLEVSNQSTGYCPKPASWKMVGKALDKASLKHPGRFTHSFEFRRCDKCESINVIKDNWYVCAVCDTDLSKKWNIE